MKPVFGLLILGLLLTPSGAATHNNPDPVAWWKLDETVAGPVEDSAGTNDGTNNGATINQPGHFGGAYSFDGTDDRIQVPDSASLDVSATLTISAWIDPEVTAVTFPRILEKTGSYNFLINGAGTELREQVCDSLTAPGSLSPTGGYYHVAVTCGPDFVRLFVNGVMVAEGVPSSHPTVTANDLFIGDRSGFDRQFSGKIDDLRIYNVALEPWQIEDLFLDPEHHQCVASYGVQGVGDLIEEMSPTLILVFAILAIIGGLIAWGAKKGSLFALLGTVFLGALSGILSTPTVTATHECVLTSFSGANTTLHFLVVLAFILVFIAVVVGGFMAHNQRKKA